MPVKVNLRHLDDGPVKLEGQLTPEELELTETNDELVSVRRPLDYNVEVVKQEQNLIVSGDIAITLDCNCARCLKPLEYDIELDPYHAFIPLEGEEAAEVANDLVDLMPFFREDVLLAFPQHPLCSESCRGLANASDSKKGSEGSAGAAGSSAWSELDKLKF